MRVPIRMCVGCRARAPQTSLLRIAVAYGHPRPDPRRRLAGRGAYVHRQMSCVERATKRGGLARALRLRLDAVSSAELRNLVATLLDAPELSDPPMNVSAKQHVVSRADVAGQPSRQTSARRKSAARRKSDRSVDETHQKVRGER